MRHKMHRNKLNDTTAIAANSVFSVRLSVVCRLSSVTFVRHT